jgi:hypothetical protein
MALGIKDGALMALDAARRPVGESADNLLVTDQLGKGSGPAPVWSLDTVFSEDARKQVPDGLRPKDPQWNHFVF